MPLFPAKIHDKTCPNVNHRVGSFLTWRNSSCRQGSVSHSIIKMSWEVPWSTNCADIVWYVGNEGSFTWSSIDWNGSFAVAPISSQVLWRKSPSAAQVLRLVDQRAQALRAVNFKREQSLLGVFPFRQEHFSNEGKRTQIWLPDFLSLTHLSSWAEILLLVYRSCQNSIFIQTDGALITVYWQKRS